MTTSIYSVSDTQSQILVDGTVAVTIDKVGGITKGSVQQMPSLSGVILTTSGTAIPVTGIPNWAKKITIGLIGVSTNGASLVQVQLGSTSFDLTTYISSGWHVISGSTGAATSTTGLLIEAQTAAASDARHGQITLLHLGNNVWSCSASINISGVADCRGGAGTKTLSGVLDRFQLNTVSTTDTFDAGSLVYLVE